MLCLVLSPLVAAQPAPSDLDVVAQIYADLARGDVDAVVAVLDDHVMWVEGPHSPQMGRHVGPGTVAARVLRPQNATPADRLGTLAVEGDCIVAVGTSRRPDPATGRLISTRFRHVWRLFDGVVLGVERTDDGPDLAASDLCGDRPC